MHTGNYITWVVRAIQTGIFRAILIGKKFSFFHRYSIHRENNVHGLTSILSIADLASNDFDDYECTIINERGSDSMVVTLSQTGKSTLDLCDVKSSFVPIFLSPRSKVYKNGYNLFGVNPCVRTI